MPEAALQFDLATLRRVFSAFAEASVWAGCGGQRAQAMKASATMTVNAAG